MGPFWCNLYDDDITMCHRVNNGSMNVALDDVIIYDNITMCHFMMMSS